MRKILITNDDGIESAGIIRLAEAALEYGEVWVIAPMHQRSGASHSISLHDPLDVIPHDFPVKGVTAFACSGTPSDCVRVGSLSVMPYKPDVVLSGINLGFNVATDLQYSATVGAAFEAAFQGYRAIALSEHLNGCHEVTDAYLKEILDEYIDFDAGYGHIVNVNFPGCALSEYRGILRNTATSHSSIYYDHYNKVCDLDGGGVRYMIEGVLNLESEPGTDFHAVFDNYISVGIVSNVGV
ncbi:MAG: 5'/3'-nucleotidase SurE [Lachnospiraceae bacterium]|nr:5'/3'-nucleotidase SurE [Lachnospiraceae bacterium]